METTTKLILEIEVRKHCVKVLIDNNEWNLMPHQISREGVIVAVKHDGIEEPYDKALEALLTEIDTATNKFRELILEHVKHKYEG